MRLLFVADAFLMGDRNLSVLPLTISLAVSVVSAITLLGLPAEMYTQVVVIVMRCLLVIVSRYFQPYSDTMIHATICY